MQLEGSLVYEGQVKKKSGQKHGFGRMTWPDNTYFEGFWIDDKAEGRGIFKTAQGLILEGEWKKDRASGLGVFKYRDKEG